MLRHSFKLLAVIALFPLTFMAGSAQAANNQESQKAVTVQTQPTNTKSLLLAKGQNHLPSRNNKDSQCQG
jgi:hypothetical protein